MKKYTLLLLVTALLSLFSAQAAQNIVKCYGQSVTLTTTKTGNSYQWYKDGTPISGATQNEYTITSVDKSAKYECKITTNGGSRTTNFLKSTNGKDYGDFEFPASQATSWDQYKESFEVDDQIRNEKYYARIELKKFMQDGVCDAGESTTTKNPNLIKPAWFNSTSAYQNNYMLAVDGPQANAGAFEFFEVYDLKLKAGQEYEFSCYIVNIDAKYTQAGRSLPQLQFKLVQGGNVLHSGNLFTIKPDLNKWDKYYVTYTPSQDIEYVKLIISNQTQGQDGNDFAIDAVYFGAKQNSASTSVTDVFNVTVYDTFDYEFVTEAVCPGTQATITTTLKPVHGGTLEPASNYKYEWKVNGTTPVVSTSKDLVVTAPNTVGTEAYVLSTSSSVCYTSGAKSQTTSVKTKDCGRTETINHPAVTVCTNQNVVLKCDKTGSSVKWSHDASIADTEITVTSSNTVNASDTYTCTITTTENGNTVTYIENFTVKTKDCTVLYESTLCNTVADSTLKASKTGTNYEYHWTLPNGDTRTTVTDTINIKHTNTEVGDKFEYSCEIYEIPYSIPDPSAPIAGRPPMLIATENFKITIVNCFFPTDKEEKLQTKEDGSITLVVPEEYRCDDCTYEWYKIEENGDDRRVTKNIGEEDYEHTIYNAQADEYYCNVITPTKRIQHTQKYKIEVYIPEESLFCYTSDSEDAQNTTLTLTPSDKDEYEWYWIQNTDTIQIPQNAIVSTENEKITLSVDYIVENISSNFPVKVHIIEKYAHKVETTTTETPEDDTITDVVPDVEDSITPDPEPAPAPVPAPVPAPAPAVPTRTYGVNINSSALSKDKVSQINDSTFTYNYQTIDETSGKTIDVADVFVVNPKCKYDETFPSKTADMSSHDCNVRLTDKGINGCSAYTKEDPNNKYFIEIDGGDTEGPVFSIKQPGKLIKGKKYILHFLARETTTIAGNPKTTNPAKIDFTINFNNRRDSITNVLTIDQQDWHRYTFEYTAKEDCDEVIITLTNYTTSSGHNDFAVDDISFTLAPESRNATVINDEVVDEDGDGYVMWQDEHIITIYPNTTQTITEVSGPNQEYEKEVTLPMGEKITFIYDPSTYSEGMTKYEANDYRTDKYGCTHSVYFTLNLISIEPMIFFTPNNDGVNDLWLVKGIETAPNAYIRIYDKYSKLLYQSKGSDFKGWDGNYNGHGMVQDDYWYVIQIPETEETISGHFILKR